MHVYLTVHDYIHRKLYYVTGYTCSMWAWASYGNKLVYSWLIMVPTSVDRTWCLYTLHGFILCLSKDNLMQILVIKTAAHKAELNRENRLSLTMGTGVIKLRILLSQIPVEWSTLCKLKFQSLVLEREGSWYPIIGQSYWIIIQVAVITDIVLICQLLALAVKILVI